MRLRHLVCFLAMGLSVATSACDSGSEPSGDEDDSPTPPPQFELLGTWEYTGGFAGLTGTMVFTEDRLEDSGDYNGTGWTIHFDTEAWDNEADQARFRTAAIEGFSHYELGDPLFASWVLAGESAAFYFGTKDYPAPKGGTEGDEFFTYTRSP